MQVKELKIENSSPKSRFTLTKELAIYRSNQIKNISYDLTFHFKNFSKYYKVETTMNFDLVHKQNLVLECACNSIIDLTVNDNILPFSLIKKIWKNNALNIPDEYLIEKTNTICVKTYNRFSNNSSGFHSYTDYKMNKQYCYIVCPPNFAHLIYPCFDQPDLKASFQLKVKAPTKWIVTSNMPVKEIKRDTRLIFPSPNYKWWIFEKSSRISTYLFSIAVGDFQVVKPQNETIVPMRLLCTQDKHQYLVQESQEFFSLVQEGIKFFQNFFGIDFPFDKYDQVFCPEFKYIAMENPGMVCITENYIFLTHTSPSKKIQRAITILHELSHMWFGNLVTMKWWDDLWLNEGFASFISYYALPQVSNEYVFESLDVKFLCYKQEALEIDGLNSTHPVTQDVRDTEAATNIFDDITYAKGSGVIKHLMYTIGTNNFCKSLTRYFQRFMWNNADSADFFNVIQEILAEEKPQAQHSYLQKWVYDWIETEGKQVVSYDLDIKEDIIQIFVRTENLPKRVTVIKHVCLEVAILYLDDLDTLTNLANQRIEIVDTQNVLTVNLQSIDPKRMGVVFNDKDHAYVDVLMDDTSLIFFLDHFSQLEPLLKVQVFFSMVKKVQMGKTNPIQLFKHISDQFATEEVPYLYSEYLIYASKIFESYLPEKLKEECAGLLFPKLLELLMKYENNSDPRINELVLTIQEYIANFAYTSGDMMMLLHWTREIKGVSDSESISGVLMGRMIEEIFWRNLLDDEQREFIRKVHVVDQPYFFNFIVGATANLQDKWSLWQKFIKFEEAEQSQYEMSCLMKGLNNPYSKDREIFANKFFEDLVLVFESNEIEYNTTFFTNLFPKSFNPDYLFKKVKEMLQRTNLCPNLRTMLEKKLYQLEICMSLEKFI